MDRCAIEAGSAGSGNGLAGMRRVWAGASLVLLLSASSVSSALDLGVSLSDGLLELTAASGGDDTGPLRLGASFLQNDDNDYMLTLAADVGNRYRLDAPGLLRYSAGARLLGISLDAPGDDVGALALGGAVGLALEAAAPTALMLEAYYAPEAFTGGDAKDLTHVALQLESRLVPGATAYTALRRIDVRSDRYPDVRVDNSLLVGVTIHF